MAEALAERERASSEREPPERVRAPHRRRFIAAFAALVALALVALAASAFVLGWASRPLVITVDPETANWSSWRPTTGGARGAQQIAEHVAPSYRLPGGKQMVAVRGGPLQIAGLPATLALRSGEGRNVSVIEGRGVLYTLCGLGPRCSIDSGKASQERHLLLRREALELALYTFRYLPNVDMVVALLPPRRGAAPSQLTLFRRDDVKSELDRPLAFTLDAPPPSLGSLVSEEGATLQRLTASSLFRFNVQQGQDARVVMVLERLT